MSDERFNSTVEEIRKIFLFLTEQEPSPDDEIEAREKLIDLFKNLESIDAHLEVSNLIEEIIDELNDWDTLDLWFKEVKDLVSKIRKIVKIDDKNSGIAFEEKIEEEVKSELKQDSSSPELDITEIVAQVADQFKGQIENLKDQIEQLQGELEKQSESIIQDDPDDVAQEEIFETIEDYSLDDESVEEESIMSDFESSVGEMKLAPPRIRIPPMKDPLSALGSQIEASLSDEEEPELTPLPKMASETSKISTIPEGEITEIPKPPSEFKLKPEIVEEPEKIPIPEEKSIQPTRKERKFKISSEVIETPDFTPVAVEDSTKPPDFTPIPSLEPKQPLTEISKLESFLKDTENEDIVPIPSEEPPKPLTEIGTLESFLLNPETKDTAPLPAGTIFTTKEEPKKLNVIPEVIETTEIEALTSEEPLSANKEPKRLKIDPEIIETPETLPFPTEEDDTLPFNLKIPSIKLEDIDDESLPSSRSDLFDVFSSVGGEIFDKTDIPPEPIELPPEEDKKTKGEKKKEKPVKPSKKEEKKLSKKEAKKEAKKESKKVTKKEAPSPSIFADVKSSLVTKDPDIPIIDLNKLPKDKDSLYQDLIALEGKRYSLERSLKQLQQDLVEKTVDEHEFENRSNDLKSKMKKISVSINTIRKHISKLQ